MKLAVTLCLGAFAVLVSSLPETRQSYDYGDVLGKSLLFYEAQRAGKLPTTKRISWRGDSMLNDGKDNGLDLTGGYFDAGDFVKFNFPMANSMTLLGWGLVDYKAGYDAAGQTAKGLDALKWGADYFIKAHPQPNVLYAQVGDGNADHASWGRPEDWTAARPSYKITQSAPGSDLAGETAAALAVTSMAFKATNPTYATTCLNHAKDLYNFAKTYQGKYSDSVPAAASFYKSWGHGDELAWAALWLYRATNTASYLTDAKKFYTQFGLNARPSSFSWDDKKAGVQVLLAKLTGEQQYKTAAQSFCDWVSTQAPKTPKGLVFLDQWGPLRHSANAAFVCMQAGQAGINKANYYTFARNQINYMLGSTGRSYVVGYGVNPPKNPHHRASSCPNRPAACGWNEYNSGSPNPQILTGALVGGPDNNDQFPDQRSDYIRNEVTTDYNAAFTSALAGLKQG